MSNTKPPAAKPKSQRHRTIFFVAFHGCFLLAMVFAFPMQTQAQQGDSNLPASITSLLEDSCYGCHDKDTREGELQLDSLGLKLGDPNNFHSWQRIYDRVRDGEMPPDESLDPKPKQAFLTALHDQLNEADSARIAQSGRVPARRLSRAQYQRSVNRLLGVDVSLEEILPADSLSGGFDTVSNSQQISDHLMAAYLRATDTAIDAALASATPREPYKVRFDWTQLRRDEDDQNRQPEGRPKHQDIVAWSTSQNFYGRMEATSVPETARYRIRVRVQAVNPPKDGHVWCSVRSGACSGKESTLYWIDGFEATSEPTTHQFDAWIRKGHMLQVRPNDSGLKKAPIRWGEGTVQGPRGFVEKLGFAGVAVKWIEMERIDPVAEQVQHALFGDLPIQINAEISQIEVLSKDTLRDQQKLIRDFAFRAFRRPVPDDELSPYFELAADAYDQTKSFTASLQSAYRAILCSSRFLYFEEAPGELDDHAIAARLSYFLWGTYPDEKLRTLADAGKLNQPQELRRQVNRLLDDPRSETFVSEFTDQWLKLYELESTTPDTKLYPEYDDVLHYSLSKETRAFVGDLIRKNLSVVNVVDSDFTFANSRLARHYKIEWPGGTGLQRVALQPSDLRGGLITHASILKVTANGTTTSPIIRGVWMLERIMGQHVPPPPANVPAVEPDIRGATTIREQLDKHRDLESCAACHVKIDPPGFALESYDVIGGYREKYRSSAAKGKKKWVDGPAVDPSYTLQTGESFSNLRELKNILKSNPDQLAASLAAQLVTYATGAQPTFADRIKLQQIVNAVKDENYGVRSLIHEVVQSKMFRQK